MLKKKRTIISWILALILVLTQSISAAAQVPQPEDILRLSGLDRYQTAAVISQEGWSNAETVVLARGDDFTDALCAGPLAHLLQSPILLTQPDQISLETLQEMKRLGVKKVIIIGGSGAISADVENALQASGIGNIERINGRDRFDTSVLIAQKMGTSSMIALAVGSDFPDALSISAIAANYGMPILLTNKNSLPDAVKQYLQGKNLKQSFVIGGTGVIREAIFTQLPNPLRLGGTDRYATNQIILEHFKDRLNFSRLYVARGDGFADALTGSVLAAKNSAAVVLAQQQLSPGIRDLLKGVLQKDSLIIGLGGLGVVPPGLLDNIASLRPATPVVIGGGGGGGSTLSTVAVPTASPAAGEIAGGTEITLSTATAGATIYYTVDGSTPTPAGTAYTAAITVSIDTTIKAIAVKAGMKDSSVLTAAYTITESEFAGGTGTSEDPYRVATAAQLDNVRNHLDKHFIQTADIDLTEYLASGGPGYHEGAGWEPIGTETNPFAGSYGGNGKMISNLEIVRPTASYQGLFGYVGASASLDDILLIAPSVHAYENVGSLAGYSKGEITDCTADDVTIIVDDAYGGGLIGLNDLGLINDSSASGNVKGNIAIGGLVGKNIGGVADSGKLQNCSSTAMISPLQPGDGNHNLWNAGGLVGENYEGTIDSCFASGDITAQHQMGGLVGYSRKGIISNSYATGKVIGQKSTTNADSYLIGGLVGISLYYDSINNCWASGAVSGQDYVGGLVGDSNNSALVTASFYDQGTTGQSDNTGKGVPKTTAEMTLQSTFTDAGWNFGDAEGIWTIGSDPASYPYLQWQGLNNIPYPPSEFAGGTGTAEDPYQVATAEQLDKVREYLDKHFVQTADIDLTEYLATGGSGYHEGAGWEPVGNDAAPFTGSYNGDDYEIANLSINRTEAVGGMYQGLFGYLQTGAAINNIHLEAPSVHAYEYVGSLAGYSKGEITECTAENVTIICEDVLAGGLIGSNWGLIDACSTSGSVKGVSGRIGGLAGNNIGDYSDTATLQDCSSSAVVGPLDSGALKNNMENAGGLVGENSTGTISNCYATGNVTGHEGVGGLVGDNWKGAISDSYATGSVVGQMDTSDNDGSYIGGLVGENTLESTIAKCWASGTVAGQMHVGGLVGSIGGSCTTSESFATGDTSGIVCVGGLAGDTNSLLANVYATGSVTGEQYVGGLLGAVGSAGRIDKSYAVGVVTIGLDKGGLAGGVSAGGTVTNSFYDQDTTGQSDIGNGDPKTTAAMTTEGTFTDAGWNFTPDTGIWTLDSDPVSYPYFQWQTGNKPLPLPV